LELDGKVAIVTGAGSGIGYAIAERFGAAGAAVCLNYLGYEDEAKALAGRLPKAIAVKADVSKPADVQAMVEATVQQLGTLDVLVNNAGLERPMPFLEVDEATWDLMLHVDLKGAFLCAQACGRVMRDSGRGGSIVNISSIAALRGLGSAGLRSSAYAASTVPTEHPGFTSSVWPERSATIVFAGTRAGAPAHVSSAGAVVGLAVCSTTSTSLGPLAETDTR